MYFGRLANISCLISFSSRVLIHASFNLGRFIQLYVSRANRTIMCFGYFTLVLLVFVIF